MTVELQKMSICFKANNNFEVVRESITKFLGIYIEKNLTWKYHIEHDCKKVSKIIGIMYKPRNILSKRLIKKLFLSFLFIAT